MVRKGRCRFCLCELDYTEQLRIGGGVDLVAVDRLACPTRLPSAPCEVDDTPRQLGSGDRMVADLAKRNSARRRWRR